MAIRTPKLQPRSLFHSYWGEFPYSNTTPSPSTFQSLTLVKGGMGLPNAPSWTGGDTSDLERGDIAFVYDALATDGSLYSPWVCLSAGTPNGLNAVWNRTTPVSGGVRDAHVIVVAHQNALGFNLTSGSVITDTRLRLNPQEEGVSADFIDSGDGAQLVTALAVAQAMLATNIGRVDVRMRPCEIRLDTSFPLIQTITVPVNVRLIGAGSGLSRILGWSINDQTIFNVQGKLSGWEISSPEPTAATSGAAQGGVVVVQNATGSLATVEDLIIKLGVGQAFARTQTVGVQIIGDSYGSTRVRDCYIRQTVDTQVALSHFALFGTDLIGVQAQRVISDLGANISDITIQNCDIAVDIFGSNEVMTSSIRALDLFRFGYRYRNSFSQADNRGAFLSQASFSFHPTAAVATTAAVRVEFSQNGTLVGPMLTSVKARWPSSVSANRHFLSVQTATSRSVRALQAVNCTVDPSPTSVGATASILLNASGGGSIRGGITTSDIANASAVLSQSGNVFWEQSHIL